MPRRDLIRTRWTRPVVAVLGVALQLVAGTQAGELARIENGAPAEAAATLPPAQSLHEEIDALIAARCTTPLAERSSDEEFVRRIYLDLTGMIPSAAEARAFLEDAALDNRARLIDRLLASPAHARRMTAFYDLMLMERRPDKNVPRADWVEYLRRAAAENRPFDQLAAELVAVDGSDAGTRAAAKFLLDREVDPNLLTRDVGRIFLGVDLQCAQCHDHPLIGDYAQDWYYGLQAFFKRSYAFTDPRSKLVSVAEKAEGEVAFKSVFHPDEQERKSGPRFLAGEPLAEPGYDEGQAYFVAPADGVRPLPKHSRRAQLAAHLAAAPEGQFAKNLGNRLWALLLGRGLVHPVDLHHGDNPPSHPELLDRLARAVVEMRYDVRGLLRELALSETYQRASQAPPETEIDAIPAESFAVAALKPLTPEQMCWSVMMATGVVGNYQQAARNELTADRRLHDALAALPATTAAVDALVEQLVYERLGSYEPTFVSLYGGQPGTGVDPFDATIHQALFMANGGTIQSWVAPFGGGLVDRLSKLTVTREIVDELYLSVLSRRATTEELVEASLYLDLRPGEQRPAALGELAWGLLASAEFRVNH